MGTSENGAALAALGAAPRERRRTLTPGQSRVRWLLVGLAVVVVCFAAAFAMPWPVGDERRSAVASLVISAFAAPLLALGFLRFTRLRRERRRRGLVIVPAVVLEIKKGGMPGTVWGWEQPVLQYTSPDGVQREARTAIEHESLKAGATVQAYVDPADPEWVAVAQENWAERTINALMIGGGALGVIYGFWQASRNLGASLIDLDTELSAFGSLDRNTVIAVALTATAVLELRRRPQYGLPIAALAAVTWVIAIVGWF